MQLLQMECLLGCITLREVEHGDRDFAKLCGLSPYENIADR